MDVEKRVRLWIMDETGSRIIDHTTYPVSIRLVEDSEIEEARAFIRRTSIYPNDFDRGGADNIGMSVFQSEDL